MPALPLGEAGPYVAAAYLVFLGLILVYVGIMASKLVRIERQTSELVELVSQRERGGGVDGGAAAGGERLGAEPANGAGAHAEGRRIEPMERA